MAVKTLTLEECSEIGAFGHSSNHISRSESLPKYLTYKGDFFFQNRQNFVEIAKMQQKFPKMFSVLEIMGIEHVAQIFFI